MTDEPAISYSQAEKHARIKQANRLMTRVLWPFLGIYPLLQLVRLNQGLNHTNYALMVVFAGFFIVLIVKLIASALTKIRYRSLIKPKRLTTIRNWVQEQYDIPLTEEQIKKLADIGYAKNGVYNSEGAQLWKRTDDGQQVVEIAFLLKRPNQPLILFNKTTQSEFLNLENRKLIEFFQTFWQTVELNNDVVYSLRRIYSGEDTVFYGVHHDEDELVPFWEDATAARLQTSDSEFEVHPLSIDDWDDVLLGLAKQNIKVGLNYDPNDPGPILDAAFVRKLIR